MRLDLELITPDLRSEMRTFTKPTEISIGRSSACVLSLPNDTMASRVHAVINVDLPLVTVQDLDSTNGMVINGRLYGGLAHEKLAEPYRLHDGDEIAIGKTKIRVHVIDDHGTPVPEIESHHQSIEPFEGNTDGFGVKLTSSLPTIPGYGIRNYLGSGRTGSSYRAVAANGATVAIKVLFPEVAKRIQATSLFKDELADLRALQHPDLTAIFGGGAVDSQTIYIVSEYANGEDLGSFLEHHANRLMPVPEALNIFRQVCGTLAYVHGAGFAHGDLRLSKIIIGAGSAAPHAKLTDVGMRKIFEDVHIFSSENIHTDGGGLEYMPPEMLADTRNAGPSADVFGLAAIFYEMVTGACPYRFFPKNDGTIRAVATDSIVPIEECKPNMPEPVVVVIDRCLQVDPDYRYHDCGELLQALESVSL